MDPSLKVIKFGKKAVYLPKAIVALIRTPRLSPYHARFQVPLNFTKFDLRDYLFHAYNVRATNIRSFVKYNAVIKSQAGPYWRPDADKFMTVQMDKPFVWPEEPKNTAPWEPAEYKATIELQANEMGKSMEARRKEIEVLEEEARELVTSAGIEGWEKRRTPKYISGEEPKYKIKV